MSIITIRGQAPSGDPHRAVVVLTTWPADRDPSALAGPLIDERLAACVNVLPAMESVYRWQGAVQRDHERQIVIKTVHGRLDELARRLQDLHPYEVPEILVLEASAGSATYLDWVAESTR